MTEAVDATVVPLAVDIPQAIPVAVPQVTIKVKYGKEDFDITLPEDSTVLQFRQFIEKKTSLLPALQKLMTPKGQLKPDKDTGTLAAAGLVHNSKVLLVGSQIMDVLALAVPTGPAPTQAVVTEKAPTMAEQKEHTKIIADGPPEDAERGDPSGIQVPIPLGANREPTLAGVLNNKKDKLRVVFRGGGAVVNTKASSFQIHPGNVRDVVSEPIPSHPGYHIVALLLRDSANSKYFLYWVPAQYLQNLRNLLLGW
jgi:hypothetical protein